MKGNVAIDGGPWGNDDTVYHSGHSCLVPDLASQLTILSLFWIWLSVWKRMLGCIISRHFCFFFKYFLLLKPLSCHHKLWTVSLTRNRYPWCWHDNFPVTNSTFFLHFRERESYRLCDSSCLSPGGYISHFRDSLIKQNFPRANNVS